MNEIKVIEERGCGIEYEVFNGDLESVTDFVADRKIAIKEEKELPLYERSYHNGNGDAFTYHFIISSNNKNYL